MRRLLLLLPLALAACDALTPSPDTPDGPLVCSPGWTVTGYFTPVEAEYLGATQTIKIPGHPSYTAPRAFLEDVTVQGWGQTRAGWYVAFYDDAWHRGPAPLSASGTAIAPGDVAVDPRVVRLGSALRIPSLPEPWATRAFEATDVGTAVLGQHIDVYTGLGAEARAEAFRITNFEAEVCHNGG